MTQKIHDRESTLLSDATDSQLDNPQPKAPRIPRARFAKTMQHFASLSPRFLCLSLCLVAMAWAGVGGSISGTIKDPSGAAIANASVTLANSATGVRQSASADGRGAYSFPVLPVGVYVLEVNQPGFKPYRRTAITLDTNSALLLDVVLQVGRKTDIVTVSDSTVHPRYLQQPDG